MTPETETEAATEQEESERGDFLTGRRCWECDTPLRLQDDKGFRLQRCRSCARNKYR